MCCNLAQICHGAEQETPAHLQEIINSRKKLVREILLSDTQAKSYIEQVKKVLSQIEDLENDAGITELNEQMMQIRYDNCLYQQQNPTIKKYFQEINTLEHNIKDMTKAERQKINILSLEMEKSGSSQTIQQKIDRLQKKMKEKTYKQVRQISRLNDQIYEVMQDRIDKARPIAQQLAQKYKKINTQLKAFNKSIENYVDKINSLFEDNETLRNARKQLTHARKQLLKLNICQEPVNERTWEMLFM